MLRVVRTGGPEAEFGEVVWSDSVNVGRHVIGSRPGSAGE